MKVAFNIDQNFFPPASIYNAIGTGVGTDVTGFGKLATNIVNLLIYAALAFGFAFIIIAGIKYVTSGGDEKKLASAHSTLTYALLGIAVAILAFAIVRILQFFLRSSVPVS